MYQNGSKFKVKPAAFVFSLHSEYWHGLNRGKTAAMWKWLCRKGSQKIRDAMYSGGSINNYQDPLFHMPYDVDRVDQTIARVLVRRFDMKKDLWIMERWEDPFFLKTNDFLQNMYRNKAQPKFSKQWNSCHDDAIEVYGSYLVLDRKGRWVLVFRYGCDGSEWNLCLPRGNDELELFEMGESFPESATDTEYDELLYQWCSENITYSSCAKLTEPTS